MCGIAYCHYSPNYRALTNKKKMLIKCSNSTKWNQAECTNTHTGVHALLIKFIKLSGARLNVVIDVHSHEAMSGGSLKSNNLTWYDARRRRERERKSRERCNAIWLILSHKRKSNCKFKQRALRSNIADESGNNVEHIKYASISNTSLRSCCSQWIWPPSFWTHSTFNCCAWTKCGPCLYI